jgi:anthranilate synthase component I
VEFTAPPFDVYRALRSVNPSPYMYYLMLGGRKIIGTSPEILVTVERGVVRVRPIAGTRPRGKDAEEDTRLETELLGDEKERAEHIMLVDLGRNDIGRVSEYGSVRVDELMTIERYSHVMHIVSNVTGRLTGDRDVFDVLRACFPAGTVSGAPKVRAMEIIDEQEPTRRGFYAGSLGYFSYSGDMDMAITIRTMLVDGQTAYLQAGGGLVADSVPANEYQECVNKARALVQAIERAEEGLD